LYIVYEVRKVGLSKIKSELSEEYWSYVNKYADVYDSRISKCFNEIPNVPDFWDEDVQPGSACKLGAPPKEGHYIMPKLFLIAQYSLSPNKTIPFSLLCQKYAAELMSNEKMWANLYGLKLLGDQLNKLKLLIDVGPDPKGQFGIEDLPKITLLEKAFDESIIAQNGEQIRDELRSIKRAKSTKKSSPKKPRRSVVMAMFDALGRAGFHRLLAGHVLSTIAEDPEAYTVFDFSRFHIIGYNSRRNYQAVYSGPVPEIVHHITTGIDSGGDTGGSDKYVCQVQRDFWKAGKDKVEATASLKRTCGATLWGKFRDNGYVTADYTPLDKKNKQFLGGYFNLCEKVCAKATGNPLRAASVPPCSEACFEKGGALKAAAGAFHSLVNNTEPGFITAMMFAAHNKEQILYNLAYQMSSLIRTIRQSAMQRGVDLPIMILHADHGPHYGDVMFSRAGRTEHKFPILAIVMPTHLFKSRPQWKRNLQINRRRLVTAFDLYHTLVEFAKWGEGAVGENNDDVKWGSIQVYDLFREQVPLNRSCKDAGIRHNLCVCNSFTMCTKKDEPAVNFQARIAVAKLNEQLKELHEDFNGQFRGKASKKDIPCAKKVTFKRAQDAKTTLLPPSITFVMIVHAKSRYVRFNVIMRCEKAEGLKPSYRHVTEVEDDYMAALAYTPCTLSSLERLSSMSEAENKMYYQLGGRNGRGNGKMCIV
jgi:hypothetical protein